MNKLSKYMKWKILSMAVFLIAIIANGCNQDSVNQPQTQPNVSFSSTFSASMPQGGILVLSDVKILIKDIKLNIAGHGEETTNFKVGPYVIHLDLSNSVNFIDETYIPAGEYDKVKFEIHKLEDNETPPDPDFVDQQGRYSVVVKGAYNGIPFVFKSGVSAHQKLTFPKSLFVTSDGLTNITLQVKPYLWFINDTGMILDPTLKSNLSVISNNIKENINENIKVFVDKDKNGEPD